MEWSKTVSISIGLGILIVGFLILAKHNNKTLKGNPSQIKLLTIGSLSGFSNGVSGSGYGPINTSGLILIVPCFFIFNSKLNSAIIWVLV